MREPRAQPVRFASASAAAFVFLLLCAPGAAAQGNRQGNKETVYHTPTTGPASRTDTAPPSIRERQFKMGEMEREASRPPTPEERARVSAQVAEDYREVQVVNNKMMAALMRAAVPDYAGVADVTAEIGKRAGRLRGNLQLPAPDANGKETKPLKYEPPADASQLKTALRALDEALMSFVNSPVFTQPDVVNVEQARRARRDLDTVIELSRLISKDAERLAKSNTKRR